MKPPFADNLNRLWQQLSNTDGEHPIGNALIQRLARQHDLVTKEEFDAQAKLLATSQAKIESLEAVIAELEKQIKQTP